MTAVINGTKIEGTMDEIAQLILITQTVTQSAKANHKIDYNSEGIESSIPTPKMPSKSANKTKTNFSAVEDMLNGKKVWRIKSGIFWKPGNKKLGIKGKGDWLGRQISNSFIKSLAGVKTGTFSWTDDNGTEHEYSGWYFEKKTQAEKALKELPLYVTEADRVAYNEA